MGLFGIWLSAQLASSSSKVTEVALYVSASCNFTDRLSHQFHPRLSHPSSSHQRGHIHALQQILNLQQSVLAGDSADRSCPEVLVLTLEWSLQ